MEAEPNDATPATVAADGAADGLLCKRCGYSLQGLNLDAYCPECGVPALASAGSYLACADPLWVARLHLGAAAGVIYGVIAAFAWLSTLVPHAAVRLPFIFNAFAWAASYQPFFAAAAAWLLSMPEGDEPPTAAANLRKGLRAAVIVLLLLHLIGASMRLRYTQHELSTILTPAAMAVTLATDVLFYLRLRHLGRLVPDEFVVRHAPLVMGGAVAATLLSNVIPWCIEAFSTSPFDYRPPMVPPLAQGLIGVAVLVYHVLLLAQAHKSFGHAAAAARDNWKAKDTDGTNSR